MPAFTVEHMARVTASLRQAQEDADQARGLLEADLAGEKAKRLALEADLADLKARTAVLESKVK